MNRERNISFCIFAVVSLVELSGVAVAQEHLDPAMAEAWKAWEAGDVEAAQAVATALSTAATESHEARHLLFLAAFVKGDYESALSHAQSFEFDEHGLTGTVLQAYLHLQRYANAEAFARTREMPAWLIAMLSSRRLKPLRVTLDELTVVPFAEHPLGEYLPPFDVEVNGHATLAHLDTGGTFLVMGPARAEALGIEYTEGGAGFHGARAVDLFYGTADSFTLGDALLENVPVTVMPSLTGTQDFLIFGTNILQRFFSTMDYANKRMILSPRTESDERKKHLAMLPTKRVTMPFYMWGDHYMIGRGALGTHEGLNFFIDSGLLSLHPDGSGGLRQAAFMTTRENLQKWGFSSADLKKMSIASDVSIRLGPIEQENVFIVVGPVGSKPFGGIRMDGLLSHAFLRHNSWTIDFDAHEYIFGLYP